MSSTLIEGRYELFEQIGRGSTGTVWDGRDLVTGESVAVKILHASLLSSVPARHRFERELASATALDHPHSVRVKAHGQTSDGNEYLVMERLAGRTLSALLADCGPLPQVRAIRIVAQILDAIAAAHRLNIVHRDVKPSNVILVEGSSEPDFVKVCDFGLAKVVQAHDDDDTAPPAHGSVSTGLGDLCGTPEYMAPEQARGEVLDGRADLYAIAVILFQAVVGELPFRGRTPLAVVSLHLSAAPPRPRVLRPDLSIAPALENLILRGLAKDRSERPSSAEVFQADLLQVERDLMRETRRKARGPTTSSDLPTLPPTPSGSSRKSMGRLALMVGGGALVVATASTLVRRRKHTEATPRSTISETAAREAIVRPPPPITTTAMSPRPTASHDEVRPEPKLSSRERPHRTPTTPQRPTRVAGTPPVPPAARPPAPAEAAIARAEDLLAEGKLAESCALGERAVASDPRLAVARGFLGRCYMRAGQADKARASYRVYLQLAPDAPDAPFIRTIVNRTSR